MNYWVLGGSNIVNFKDNYNHMMKRAMSKTFSHNRMIIGEFHLTNKKQL